MKASTSRERSPSRRGFACSYHACDFLSSPTLRCAFRVSAQVRRRWRARRKPAAVSGAVSSDGNGKDGREANLSRIPSMPPLRTQFEREVRPSLGSKVFRKTSFRSDTHASDNPYRLAPGTHGAPVVELLRGKVEITAIETVRKRDFGLSLQLSDYAFFAGVVLWAACHGGAKRASGETATCFRRHCGPGNGHKMIEAPPNKALELLTIRLHFRPRKSVHAVTEPGDRGCRTG